MKPNRTKEPRNPTGVCCLYNDINVHIIQATQPFALSDPNVRMWKLSDSPKAFVNDIRDESIQSGSETRKGVHKTVLLYTILLKLLLNQSAVSCNNFAGEVFNVATSLGNKKQLAGCKKIQACPSIGAVKSSAKIFCQRLMRKGFTTPTKHHF